MENGPAMTPWGMSLHPRPNLETEAFLCTLNAEYRDIMCSRPLGILSKHQDSHLELLASPKQDVV